MMHGVQRRAGALLTVVLALVVVSSSVHAGLAEDVDRAVRNARAAMRGATIGVSVRDADRGTELVSINAATKMIPASNQKLLTTGAALDVLGADFEFTTQFRRDGDRLIVIGGGDPAFGDPELLEQMATATAPGLTVDEFLGLITAPIVANGFTEISEVVIDDRIFEDAPRVHDSWPKEQLNRSYCAEVSGLSFHLNVLHFFPRPTSGRPALDKFVPRGPLPPIRNRGTSRRGASDSNTAWFARPPQSNNLTFNGNVKHAYKVPVPVTLHDPALFFGEVFAERLRRDGATVGAVRRAEPGESWSSATELLPPPYTPISRVVTRCNTDSENLYAECLLKRIGRAQTGQPGSWLNGASIVRHVVHRRLGSPRHEPELVVADGSGLSRENRVAPTILTRWLASIHNDDAIADVFRNSLAVGGISGTLRASKRPKLTSAALDGAVVYAKTGYINGVSCLSGYVVLGDGAAARTRCFSVMVNDIPAGIPIRTAKALQDTVVRLIVDDMLGS